MSQMNRCIPALAESDCEGRIQYPGILNFFESACKGLSSLEYRLTNSPLAFLISSVTGPADVGREKVVDHRAVRRILSGRLIRRQRRVRVHAPANAQSSLWLEKPVFLFRGLLAERSDVIQDPESAAVCADDEIVILDDEIANGSGRQIQSERFPIVAVVEGDVNALFRSGEKQALLPGIFANGIDRFARAEFL